MYFSGVVTFRSQQALSQTPGKLEAELSEEERVTAQELVFLGFPNGVIDKVQINTWMFFQMQSQVLDWKVELVITPGLC